MLFECHQNKRIKRPSLAKWNKRGRKVFPLRPKISPLRSKVSLLRSKIIKLRPEVSLLWPEGTPLRPKPHGRGQKSLSWGQTSLSWGQTPLRRGRKLWRPNSAHSFANLHNDYLNRFARYLAETYHHHHHDREESIHPLLPNVENSKWLLAKSDCN